jgi:hypothetical protein
MADSDFISEKDIPETWTPVTPQAQQTAPAPPSSGPDYTQGTISSSLQHDSTFVETQYKTAGIPQTPLMPIGTGASAQANATSQSVIKNYVISNNSTTALQTNNINNATQTKLNLQSGIGVSLTSDQTGNVTINSVVSAGDILLRDDFLNPNTYTPSGAVVSELQWIAESAGSTTYPSLIIGSGSFPVQGYVHFTNDGTASDTSFLMSNFAVGNNIGAFPLLDYPGWKVIWVFQPSRMTSSASGSALPPAFNWGQVSFYIGLANYLGSKPTNTSSGRPPHFLGLRYDTTPGIGDTQFVCEYVSNLTSSPLTRINTQGTTVQTGITPVEGVAYYLEISCVASGQIGFRLYNGSLSSLFTTTMTVNLVSSSENINALQGANGIWQAFPSSYHPYVPGSKFTISNCSITAANGSWVGISSPGADNYLSWFNTGTQASVNTTGTITMFPALQPLVSFGNDSQANPVDGSKGVMIDFFSLVWSQSLASAFSPANTSSSANVVLTNNSSGGTSSSSGGGRSLL